MVITGLEYFKIRAHYIHKPFKTIQVYSYSSYTIQLGNLLNISKALYSIQADVSYEGTKNPTDIPPFAVPSWVRAGFRFSCYSNCELE